MVHSSHNAVFNFSCTILMRCPFAVLMFLECFLLIILMSFWCVATFFRLFNGAKVTRGAIRKFSQLYEIKISEEILLSFIFYSFWLVARVAYRNRKLFLITNEGKFSSLCKQYHLLRRNAHIFILNFFAQRIAVAAFFRCPIAHYRQAPKSIFFILSCGSVSSSIQITLGI